MTSFDAPSLSALSSRLRSLAGGLAAATGGPADEDVGCPPALRADARLAHAGAVDLGRVADACGSALATYAYAAAALDRDRALLESEALRHGLRIDVGDVLPPSGVRAVTDPIAEVAAREAQGRIRRRLLLLAEEESRLGDELRVELTRHTAIAATIAARLR
ncbi:MAG: hypothetical protein U0Q21_03810 [Dermatophilaceae bacterium]